MSTDSLRDKIFDLDHSLKNYSRMMTYGPTYLPIEGERKYKHDMQNESREKVNGILGQLKVYLAKADKLSETDHRLVETLIVESENFLKHFDRSKLSGILETCGKAHAALDFYVTKKEIGMQTVPAGQLIGMNPQLVAMLSRDYAQFSLALNTLGVYLSEENVRGKDVKRAYQMLELAARRAPPTPTILDDLARARRDIDRIGDEEEIGSQYRRVLSGYLSEWVNNLQAGLQ